MIPMSNDPLVENAKLFFWFALFALPFIGGLLSKLAKDAITKDDPIAIIYCMLVGVSILVYCIFVTKFVYNAL